MDAIRGILLAEDNPNDVELTLAAFAEHNLANEIFVVSDGEQALDYLYQRGRFKDRAGGNPVVMLLDLKMPKVDGLEVLRIIKKDEKLQSIPVVILTSSREEPDLHRSYKFGANAYVVKPVGFEEFTKAAKLVGAFWAVLNEPPLSASAQAAHH